MKIGIPKEIKNNESRVGMTPSGVFELTKKKHTVFVQTTAGEGSGFFDRDYQEVGATILPSIEEVYNQLSYQNYHGFFLMWFYNGHNFYLIPPIITGCLRLKNIHLILGCSFFQKILFLQQVEHKLTGISLFYPYSCNTFL